MQAPAASISGSQEGASGPREITWNSSEQNIQSGLKMQHGEEKKSLQMSPKIKSKAR
jgi:hypothetical protein